MKTHLSSPLHLLLFTALFCGFSAVSQAQIAKFGIRAGVVGSSFYDDAKAQDIKTRIGFTGGSFVKFGLGNRIAIRPELLFVLKGSNFDYPNYQNTQLKLNYIEVPISLELRIFKIINLHGGVFYDYLLSGNLKVQDPNGYTFKKEDVNLSDYGWHVGTGLELGPVGIHLRLSRGTQNVAAGNNFRNVVGSLKNAVWSLSLAAAL